MKFIKKFITVSDSSIIVLLIFITKANPISLLEPYLPQYFLDKLSEPSNRLTINTAIILLLCNCIFNIFGKKLIKININLNNLDGTPVTSISVANVNQRPRKLNLDINMKFVNKFSKTIINFLGGVYIFVENTTWTSIQAEKNSPLFRSAIDDSTTNEYIRIDMNKFFGNKELKKSLRININILSDSTEPLSGAISVEIGSKKRNKIIDCILKSLVSYDECSHDLQSNSEVN